MTPDTAKFPGQAKPPERAKYHVGQVIHHTLFDYRGVIVDVDADFRIGGELKALENRPHKSQASPRPWYHVLVDGTADRAYVSEQNLEPDPQGGPVEHPDLVDYFVDLGRDGYVSHAHKVN